MHMELTLVTLRGYVPEFMDELTATEEKDLHNLRVRWSSGENNPVASNDALLSDQLRVYVTLWQRLDDMKCKDLRHLGLVVSFMEAHESVTSELPAVDWPKCLRNSVAHACYTMRNGWFTGFNTTKEGVITWTIRMQITDMCTIMDLSLIHI
eukprot:TRINITY_DN18467_c0_g1_i1.p1 TRINITY_DN18467_c0_g1~~TRINITY_DN18467_c0_g1_i1.p1  ORF type:complete len:152 (+),score=13.70 TRINITY_DN18467_c0_g1_i1:163-618(+)